MAEKFAERMERQGIHLHISEAAVDVLAGYTGVALALNYATAFVAVVLGAPGVVMLLLLRAVLVL